MLKTNGIPPSHRIQDLRPWFPNRANSTPAPPTLTHPTHHHPAQPNTPSPALALSCPSLPCPLAHPTTHDPLTCLTCYLRCSAPPQPALSHITSTFTLSPALPHAVKSRPVRTRPLPALTCPAPPQPALPCQTQPGSMLPFLSARSPSCFSRIPLWSSTSGYHMGAATIKKLDADSKMLTSTSNLAHNYDTAPPV